MKNENPFILRIRRKHIKEHGHALRIFPLRIRMEMRYFSWIRMFFQTKRRQLRIPCKLRILYCDYADRIFGRDRLPRPIAELEKQRYALDAEAKERDRAFDADMNTLFNCRVELEELTNPSSTMPPNDTIQ